eukprot:tig00000478_g1277.t1
MEGQAAEQVAAAPVTAVVAERVATVLGESIGMGGRHLNKRMYRSFLLGGVQYDMGEVTYIDIGHEKHVAAIEKIYTRDENPAAVLVDIRWYFFPRHAYQPAPTPDAPGLPHPAEPREIFFSESREKGQPAESAHEKVAIYHLKPDEPSPILPEDNLSFLCRSTYVAATGTLKPLPGRIIGVDNGVLEESDLTDDESQKQQPEVPQEVQQAMPQHAEHAPPLPISHGAPPPTPGADGGDVSGKRQRRASRKKQEAGELSEEEDDQNDDDFGKGSRKRRSAKKKEEEMGMHAPPQYQMPEASMPVDPAAMHHAQAQAQAHAHAHAHAHPMEEVAASGGVMVQHGHVAHDPAAHAHAHGHVQPAYHHHHQQAHMTVAVPAATMTYAAPASSWTATIQSLPTLMAPGPLTLPGRSSDMSDGKAMRKRSRRMKDGEDGMGDDRPAYESFLQYIQSLDNENLQEMYWKYMEQYKTLFRNFQKAKDVVNQKRDDLERRKSTMNTSTKQDPHPPPRRISQPPQPRRSTASSMQMGEMGGDDGTGAVQMGPDGMQQPIEPVGGGQMEMMHHHHQVEHEVMEEEEDMDDGDGSGSRRRRRSAYELFDMHMKRFHRNHARALSMYEEAVMMFFGWILSIKSEIQARVATHRWGQIDGHVVAYLARNAKEHSDANLKESERLANLRRKPGRKPKQNMGVSSPAPLPQASGLQRYSGHVAQGHMQHPEAQWQQQQQQHYAQHAGGHVQQQMTAGFAHYTTQAASGVPMVVVAAPQGMPQYAAYAAYGHEQQPQQDAAAQQAQEYAAAQQQQQAAAEQQYAQQAAYAQQPAAEYAQAQPAAEYAQAQPAAEYAQAQPAAEYAQAQPAAEYAQQPQEAAAAAEAQPADATQAQYTYAQQ